MVTEPLSPQAPLAQLLADPAAGPAPADLAPGVEVEAEFDAVEATLAPCAVLDLIKLLIIGIKLLINWEIIGPIISVPLKAAPEALDDVDVAV
jgi:hypothetical protein